MTDIVIVAATRTPVGSFNGSLAGVSAVTLGETVIKEVLRRSGVAPADVSEVILGQVLTAATGQNPARQASIKAGLPIETPAFTINQVCGSGLRTVALGAQQILTGDASIVIAGGQESMSQSAHAIQLRAGIKMGDGQLIDTMIRDGLWDAFNGYHMGTTAENVAKKWEITREDQDTLAYNSQRKAAEAQAAGRFKDEIVGVKILVKRQEVLFEQDEYIKADTTPETLAKLRPAFSKDGTVTAGNASGINDGASVVLLMTEKEAARRNLKPLARIASWAQAGVDPALMGSGPIPASLKALEKAGWKADDLDLIEANEAFAAQACAVNKTLGWDTSKVNVNGGAIALGHPIGASGNRILVTLLHELNRRGGKKGLATLCIGGGMGIALTVEAF